MSLVALCPEFFRAKYDWLTGGWGHELTANEWLGIVIGLGALKWIGVWLVLLWRPLRLALTPRAVKAAQVRARATDPFKVGTEAQTLGRPGVQRYIGTVSGRESVGKYVDEPMGDG